MDVNGLMLNRLVAGTGFAVLLAMTTVAGQAPVDVHTLGPQVGQAAPPISGVDQLGREQTLASIMGEQGAMVVFYRSADW